MTSGGARGQPVRWSTLTPRIVVGSADRLVEFLRRVFDAAGTYERAAPSVLRIGDSRVMVSDAGAREATTAFLNVYVDDVDATYERAVAEGATSTESPFDTPYGDRRAMVVDPWGNAWQIA